MVTNSKQIFDVITHASHTTEKPSLVGLDGVREAYGNFEISNIGLVAGSPNLADRLTQSKIL